MEQTGRFIDGVELFTLLTMPNIVASQRRLRVFRTVLFVTSVFKTMSMSISGINHTFIMYLQVRFHCRGNNNISKCETMRFGPMSG